MIRSLPVALILSGLALPVAAQELTVYGGAALQFTAYPDSETKSDLNGYVELEFSGIYGGIWAETSSQSDANEVDLYLGYRGEAGALSYDVSYTRYFYPNDGGDCCGEVGLVLGYAVTEQVSLGTEFYVDPVNDTNSAYLTFDVSATDQLSISGEYGTYDEGFGRFAEWDLGVGYALGEETSLELRYYKGEEYDGYVRLQLAWDTTILPR
ncbi:TorF family putative porin [Tabrizicola fusiformis]|uniref:hypothetical protein n=1 Tax=Tabrizicola sp. SY72 TaxID=2741673 RepID=UPI0015730FFB|nr:hypothetical protein [Tabrizicola sp. SY72]NTT84814.1 hypothetical protein [Tabrizicola sp. SY72]